MGNYDTEEERNAGMEVIPLRRENGELRHGCRRDHWNHRYTTTREKRENGEIRLIRRVTSAVEGYTTTRENGEQRQCLCPKYSVMISPHIISAFTVFVNPQMERNVFNKNSPWKWMLPSLEFPWQALIRMTDETQFAF